MTKCSRLGALTAAVALLLLQSSHAQLLPAIGLTAEVLGAQSNPVGDTFYGTPRTFTAIVANLGTATAIQGNLTFLAGGVPICTTPLLPDPSLAGASVSLANLNPAFAVQLLNSLLVSSPQTSILGSLTPVVQSLLNLVLGILGQTTVTLNNIVPVTSLLQTLGLNTLTINAAVFASCTTSIIPVGQYTGLTVAYADLNVGGNTVSLRPLLDIPLLSPTATLGLGAFNILKAPDTVAAASNPAPTPVGVSTPLTVTVSNAAAPPSLLPPDGGTVAAFLGQTPIGSGPITSSTGSTSTFTFPITVPANTPAGPQTITLAYSGTSNFLPAVSGFGGSPAGPTLTVPSVIQFAATPTPGNPAAGTPVTITGTATNPSGGAAPTGTVSFTVNGVTTPAFPLTAPGTGSVSTFTGTLSAPATPGSYPVTVNFVPSNPAFIGPAPPTTFNLPVSAAASTVTANVSPTNPTGFAPVVVTGQVTGSNGLPAVGTVDIKVDGNTVRTVSVNPVDGTYTGTFPAPGTAGTYQVTATFNPAPGNSLAPATSPATPITVTASTASITQTITPNPVTPGGAATVAGTVTTTTGSPAGGTVVVTLNGVPVGTATVGADGKFSLPFTAPTTPGTYTLLTTFTPSGAASPTAAVLTTFTVSAGGSGNGQTSLTISFGNGGTGFSFPNCLGSLAINVAGSGTPSPTGTVTLSVSGGKLGDTSVSLGTADFASGVATFNFESLMVKKELLNKFVTHLTDERTKKSHLTLGDIHNYDLFPEGDFLLLPGDYTLTASYPGDSNYAAASGSSPFKVDPLCLLLALARR